MAENFTTMTVGNYVFEFDFDTKELRLSRTGAQTTLDREETIALGDFLFEVLSASGQAPRILPLTITGVEVKTDSEDQESPPDWKTIEAQAAADLERVQTDQDAYNFIEKYLSRDLRGRYLAIYRSDRHEMNRSPRQAIDSLLSLPPLE